MRYLSYLLLMIFSIIVFSCKPELKNHIPEKSSDISQGKYDKYLGLLNDAYSVNDKLDAAVQLANLGSDTGITFDMLNAGIKENPNKCEKIYDWFWMYDRHDFGVNIIMLDTALFRRSVELCNKEYEHSSYADYALMKDQEERDAIANRPEEDSSAFNLSLVRELKQIHFDDQDIRNRVSAKTTTPAQKVELYKEMHIVDSINLVKVGKIFKEHGYPSRELVGRDCNFTPALVIHHSNSLETRYEYLPFLEKAVEDGLLGNGTLNMIKRRMQNMELDKEGEVFYN